MKEEKKEQRRLMLERLAAVPAAVRRMAGERIAEQVLALPEMAEVRRLMAFLSMDDELDADPLVEAALEAGIEVYSPRTMVKARRVVPVRVRSLDEVVAGAYGIREPAGDERLAPSELDAVVVPAVAFDDAGFRLGRGGGYYDRLLEGLDGKALACGIGYAMQVVDEVVREPHDLPVDLIVTERGVIRPG